MAPGCSNATKFRLIIAGAYFYIAFTKQGLKNENKGTKRRILGVFKLSMRQKTLVIQERWEGAKMCIH